MQSWLLTWVAETCEGRFVETIGDSAPVRVSHDEALRMRADTSAYMLRLSLAVHAAHSFTNAAATDGSLLAHGSAVTRVAFGAFGCSVSGCAVMGGALPSGSSVPDAELVAIVQYLEHVWTSVGAGGTPARVLILSDCLGVLTAIEKARRARSLRELRTKHRRLMIGRVLALVNSARISVTVFVWVRGHRGVYPNHYADAVANAALRLPVRDTTELLATLAAADAAFLHRVSTVGYAVPVFTSEGYRWQETVADRSPLLLARRRLALWVVRELSSTICDGPTDRRSSAVACAAIVSGTERLDGWPAVLGYAASLPAKGGSGKQASSAGVVFMARSGQFGLPADYDEADDTICSVCAAQACVNLQHAMLDVLHSSGGAHPLVTSLLAALDAMLTPLLLGMSDAYRTAVLSARATMVRLVAGHSPGAAEWQQALAVVGGWLPHPGVQELRRAAQVLVSKQGGTLDRAKRDIAGSVGHATVEASTALWRIAAAWRAKRQEADDGQGWTGAMQGDDERDDGDDEAFSEPEPDDDGDEADSEADDVSDDEVDVGLARRAVNRAALGSPRTAPVTAQTLAPAAAGSSAAGPSSSSPASAGTPTKVGNIPLLRLGQIAVCDKVDGRTTRHYSPLSIQRNGNRPELGNPFRMGRSGHSSRLRPAACAAHHEWLHGPGTAAAAREAARHADPELLEYGQDHDAFSDVRAPAFVAKRDLTIQQLARAVRDGGDFHFQCACGLLDCHGDALRAHVLAMAHLLPASALEQKAALKRPSTPRKQRSDKGVTRGPRTVGGVEVASRMGLLALLRLRHGY